MKKKCTKCKKRKPLEEFYPGRGECKICKQKYYVEYAKQRHAEWRAMRAANRDTP